MSLTAGVPGKSPSLCRRQRDYVVRPPLSAQMQLLCTIPEGQKRHVPSDTQYLVSSKARLHVA